MIAMIQMGVSARKSPQRATKTPAISAFQTRTRLNPKRWIMGVATSFMAMAPTALVNVIMPAENGDSPKPTCSRMASKKGVAPMAKRHRLPPKVEMAKVGVRSSDRRSEEHTSELQSLMRISYAVFCLKKKKA